MYQRIGFQCFTETLFEDAGKNLFNGDLDPSVLVSYYPELRGSLFSADDTLDVYAGVAERMPREASVDEISKSAPGFLQLLSSAQPPLTSSWTLISCGQPSQELFSVSQTRHPNCTAHSGTEKDSGNGGCGHARALSQEVQNTAKCRGQAQGRYVLFGTWRFSVCVHVLIFEQVVDTVLAKIYAQAEKTKELYALIQQPHEIVLSEIEPVLKQTGQYNALCMLYKQTGDDENLLQVWAKYVSALCLYISLILCFVQTG